LQLVQIWQFAHPNAAAFQDDRDKERQQLGDALNCSPHFAGFNRFPSKTLTQTRYPAITRINIEENGSGYSVWRCYQRAIQCKGRKFKISARSARPLAPAKTLMICASGCERKSGYFDRNHGTN
jgi:hypothetical protein